MATDTLIQIDATADPLAKAEKIDLTQYDHIVINHSGGKDSSVIAWYVVKLAQEQGVADRVVAVHATFPEEWADAESVTKKQCEALGIPVTVVTRGEALLDYVRRRGLWPSNAQRYCTSDFKRGPIDKFITHLPGHKRNRFCTSACEHGSEHQRVLNVMGLRAQESPARAKRIKESGALSRDERRSTKTRTVDEWLPIAWLSEADVWAIIRREKLATGECYSLGFTRMSCRVCIFASENTLLAAAHHHPELFAEYVAVERETGHKFRQDVSLADVWARYQAGERASGKLDFSNQL